MQLIDFLVVASSVGSVGAWAGYAFAVCKMESAALKESERSFVSEYVEKNDAGGCTVHKLPFGAWPEWADSVNPIHDGKTSNINDELHKARNNWHSLGDIAKVDQQRRGYSVGNKGK